MASSSSPDPSDDESVFASHYLPSRSPSSSSSSSSSPSPPPPTHNFFAPPFYNRPPTPLPPSPSLTSLLRPSRPTTPDTSDIEFEPVPRASPKVPTYEYYGFVLYLFSSLAFLMYLLWSYLPSPFLHALGIYYYPNRWWSLAIPSWLVMGLCYIYVALAAYNTGYLTLPMSSIETIIDEAANVATLDGKGHMKSLHAHAHVHAAGAGAGSGSGRRKNSNTGNGVGHGHSGKDARREKRELREKRKEGRESEVERDWRALWSVGTDACLDVPLGGVCEVLYGEGRDRDPEEDGGVYGWVEG